VEIAQKNFFLYRLKKRFSRGKKKLIKRTISKFKKQTTAKVLSTRLVKD